METRLKKPRTQHRSAGATTRPHSFNGIPPIANRLATVLLITAVTAIAVIVMVAGKGPAQWTTAWKGYYTVLVAPGGAGPEDWPPEHTVAIGALARALGTRRIIAAGNAFEYIATFDAPEKIRIIDLQSRLDELDPRYDPYLREISRYFTATSDSSASGGEVLFVAAEIHPLAFYIALSVYGITSGTDVTMLDYRPTESIVMIVIGLAYALLLMFVPAANPGYSIRPHVRTPFVAGAMMPWLATFLTGDTAALLVYASVFPFLVACADYSTSLLLRSQGRIHSQRAPEWDMIGLILSCGFLICLSLVTSILIAHESTHASILPLAFNLAIIPAIWFLSMNDDRTRSASREKNKTKRSSVTGEPASSIVVRNALGIIEHAATNGQSIDRIHELKWKTVGEMRWKAQKIVLPVLLPCIVIAACVLLVPCAPPSPQRVSIAAPAPTAKLAGVTMASLRQLRQTKPENALPDLSDFIVHTAYQDGFAYGVEYGFPDTGLLTIPTFSRTGIDQDNIARKDEVVLVFDDAWLANTLPKDEERVPTLLVRQERPVHVVMRPWQDVSLHLRNDRTVTLILSFILIISFYCFRYLTFTLLYVKHIAIHPRRKINT